jgi:hypothetical protein
MPPATADERTVKSCLVCLFIENTCTSAVLPSPSQSQPELKTAFMSAASSTNAVLEVRTLGF